MEETRKKIATLEKEKANPEDLNALKKSLQELELEEQKVKAKEEELKKKEKLTPWNVDTIAQAGFTKTVINTKPRRRPDEEDQALPDDVREMKMKEFVKTNEKSLKKFGMLRRYDDSKQYLQENSHLVCENTANYLVIWCINLEMEEVNYFLIIINFININNIEIIRHLSIFKNFITTNLWQKN